MLIKGIIFDFDGLICDTEIAEVEAWQQAYAQYSLVFSIEEYINNVGAVFSDQISQTHKLPGIELIDIETADKVLKEFNRLFNIYANLQPLMPGIKSLLEQSNSLNLEIGLASSSPWAWVINHLDRLKIKDYFNCILTREKVKRTKPDPEIFIQTLECMRLKPDEVIVLEDSENGVIAANKAGLYTVAVPNSVTRTFSFEKADLILNSLENKTIEWFKNKIIS